jgi:hypothetical protein
MKNYLKNWNKKKQTKQIKKNEILNNKFVTFIDSNQYLCILHASKR